MGLLESMLGSALGNTSSSSGGGLADVIGGLLDKNGEHGGLDGLVARFNEAGMGDVVSSWIGRGENLPISPDQLSGVLGSDALAGLAARFGIDPVQASGVLSQVLPGLIDKLTPHGTTEGVDASSMGNLGGLGGLGGGDLMGMLGGLLKPR